VQITSNGFILLKNQLTHPILDQITEIVCETPGLDKKIDNVTDTLSTLQRGRGKFFIC
jgi:hypothetical protein